MYILSICVLLTARSLCLIPISRYAIKHDGGRPLVFVGTHKFLKTFPDSHPQKSTLSEAEIARYRWVRPVEYYCTPARSPAW